MDELLNNRIMPTGRVVARVCEASVAPMARPPTSWYVMPFTRNFILVCVGVVSKHVRCKSCSVSMCVRTCNVRRPGVSVQWDGECIEVDVMQCSCSPSELQFRQSSMVEGCSMLRQSLSLW